MPDRRLDENNLIEVLQKLKDIIIPITNNAGSHNAFYRGKSLGSSVTAEQWAAIDAGTFNDMYIGDYWEINNRIWYIAAFNYWLNTGDTPCTTNHVNIIPAINLATGWMNKTSVTTNAYVASDYYQGTNGTTGKAVCEAIINAAFGASHILSHREYLKNATAGSGTAIYENNGTWVDSTFELMTERMVYGNAVFGNSLHGTSYHASHTIDHTQLPIFAYNKGLICTGDAWWLRDVGSSTQFCNINSNGLCSYNAAGSTSMNFGYRPIFAICA